MRKAVVVVSFAGAALVAFAIWVHCGPQEDFENTGVVFGIVRFEADGDTSTVRADGGTMPLAGDALSGPRPAR